MRTLEMTGRTVEEAVSSALQELGVGRSQVEIEILEEPAPRLLGLFGGRDARVRATVREQKSGFVKRFSEKISARLAEGIAVEVTEDDDLIKVDIHGDDVGLLIGKHGQTLDALELLVNAAASRIDGDRRPVKVDIEGYRERREQTISRLARRTAAQVARTGRDYSLEPMSSADRKLVHLCLKDHPGVITQSVGRDPQRRVVIRPRGRSGSGRVR